MAQAVKHEHKEEVYYSGRTYVRTYKHAHIADQEAHSHINAWQSESKHRTEHNAWSRLIPYIKTEQTTIEYG